MRTSSDFFWVVLTSFARQENCRCKSMIYLRVNQLYGSVSISFAFQAFPVASGELSRRNMLAHFAAPDRGKKAVKAPLFVSSDIEGVRAVISGKNVS